ncbi:hypothetical protein, conserved [Eimeria acervulina]|uniref:Protein kinase domain-containing protein n=1 Tax=Eimeria acervulina TaxID=5801 RepID=U6GSR8_EIMAC|nr:hypothetical protein, conserved [Eimeria acervulina]CDI83301.1 hypothetical protein, conserved [Eimeria acervulina]
MDRRIDPGETSARVESEPVAGAKNFLVDTRKVVSSSPVGRVSLAPLALAAASMIVFIVVHGKVSPPADRVDSENATVQRTAYARSSSSLSIDEQVERTQKQAGTDGRPVGGSGKPHTRPRGKAELSGSLASVLSIRRPTQPVTNYDDWGLPSLEDFERTLSSRLKQGKAALAAWAVEFYTSDAVAQSVETSQRIVCEALWERTVGSFVGMVLVLRGTRPLKLDDEIRHLPHVLRVTKVAGVLRWGLLLHAEDIDANREFSLQIPMLDEDVIEVFGVETFLGKAREAFKDERNAEIQACGSVSAALTASLKGFAVTLYTAEIVGVSPVCSAGETLILNQPKLLEKFQGTLNDLKKSAPGVMAKARDYIATRLLHIVLKLEKTGIGHLALDWDSLFLREDGSFLLGDFGSSAPFGRPIISELASLSDHLEPGILAAEDTGLSPAPGTNLWSLGIMLFQLYTGKDNPYGTEEGNSHGDAAKSLAKGLLTRGVRSYILNHELAASNVPLRWQQLILRLLEPRSSNRINGFEIIWEFFDLLSHPAE